MAVKKVLINICRAPFGTVFYTEGLRAAVGTSAGIDENIPTVLFQADGVFYCLKDVDRSDAISYFKSFKDMGTKLYAVKESHYFKKMTSTWIFRERSHALSIG
jgi:sulfur relay (sulfurtransferase) DsrF/TusC family protein